MSPSLNLETSVPSPPFIETMPRPQGSDEFLNWLVPARNNIQREMLRLKPLFRIPPATTAPTWIFEGRHLILGSCFSLWRSVFQAREQLANRLLHEDGAIFLDKLISDNAATYSTELNQWSLQYYIENAVYRLQQARHLAIENGVAPAALPEARMIGPAAAEHHADPDTLFQTRAFSPYAEWEECLTAAGALITAMDDAARR